MSVYLAYHRSTYDAEPVRRRYLSAWLVDKHVGSWRLRCIDRSVYDFAFVPQCPDGRKMACAHIQVHRSRTSYSYWRTIHDTLTAAGRGQ